MENARAAFRKITINEPAAKILIVQLEGSLADKQRILPRREAEVGSAAKRLEEARKNLTVLKGEIGQLTAGLKSLKEGA